MNIYETDKVLSEYLLFHYGTAEETLPWTFGPHDALGYAERVVSECLDLAELPENSRALDLGCAVGRSTFELARHCAEVIGIDYSELFVETAAALQRAETVEYLRVDEGALTSLLRARVPPEIDMARVRFERGDATNLRADIGTFDVVLMANLVDRLMNPQGCLERLPELVRPGGQLVVSSPYTWLEEFTARERWLGGFEEHGHRVLTRDGLHEALKDSFQLTDTRDLPFLIREHARKYQWSVAEATIWRRK
jgi:putative 4-mercaptohistidine N1-methyltranferase